MAIGIDPQRDLYGGLLFHKGRFKRLKRYLRLGAKQCLAEIEPPNNSDWFGRYLPAGLCLGDAGARDVAIHAIQACIPQATLLPTGVDRLEIDATNTTGPLFVTASERLRDGDTFTYDIEVSDEDGRLRERWEGLRLRLVSRLESHVAWVEPLLGPYIERRVEELIPGVAVRVAVEREESIARHLRSDRAIQRALGSVMQVGRRCDGKPELTIGEDVEVSAAHAGDLTMAMAGQGPLGCDVEQVDARSATVWRDLLGPERFALAELVARQREELRDIAATRVWVASESLKKAGATVGVPLLMESATSDGWVILSAGEFVAATYLASTRSSESKIVLGLLVRRDNARLRVPAHGRL
jgi:enediyne polyketide synthase